LPTGLTFDGEGQLYGTPKSAGSVTFTVRVGDHSASPQSASKSFLISIGTTTLMFTTPRTLPGATQGVPYNLTFAATGGTPPYTFADPIGVPNGFTFTNGVLSGAPASNISGNWTFIVQVTDAASPPNVVAVLFSINIAAPAPVLVLQTNPMTFNTTLGVIPQFQLDQVTSTGGPAELNAATIAYGPGASNWLAVAPDQVESTPLSFQVSVNPNAQGFAANTYTATVTFTSSTPGVAPVVLAVNLVIPAAPVLVLGKNPVTFNTTVGVVPPFQLDQVTSTGATAELNAATIAYGPGASNWLAVAPDQVESTPFPFQVSVNPNAQSFAANTYTATVTYTSSTPGVAPVVLAVSLVIAPAPLAITQTSVPVATYGSPYLGGNGLQFTATGGTPPYSWSETGALPQGMMLSSTGLLAGTPEAANTFRIAVAVTDNSMPPMNSANVLNLVVNGPLVITTNATLPAATVNTAYSKTIAAVGGMQPYSFAVAAGSTLPGGLTLSPGGVLSGTPTTAGSYSFTLQVTDATTPTPNVTTKPFTLMVN
jgi:hypothetical protein